MLSRFRVAFALSLATPAAVRWFCVGAHRFAHERLDWQVLRVGSTAILTWSEALSQKPDGVLGILEPDQPFPAPEDVAAPVVILNTAVRDHPFHSVTSDDQASGRLAALHLLGRRLKHFAYVGRRGVYFGELRQRGFEQVLREAGYRDLPVTLLERGGMGRDELRQWLVALPQPCGILCANDGLAHEVVESARQVHLRVPEQLAVIGVSDDELGCVECPVTLTSVHEDFVEVGYRAAAHLDRLMRGHPVPGERVVLPPGDVIERDSTRTVGVSDPIVRRALIYIQQQCSEHLTVDALVHQLGNVSRRHLEMRFEQTVGRSPYQFILRARVTHAQRLLRRTRKSIGEIALQTGFYDTPQFSRNFKAITGRTPTAFRNLSEDEARAALLALD